MEITKCHEIEPLLDGLHDGELSGDELVLTQAHLNQCELCSAKLEEIKTVSIRLSQLPKISLKKDLAAEILSRSKPTSNLVLFRSKKIWAAAAAFVVLGLAFQYMSREQTPEKIAQTVDKNVPISPTSLEAKPVDKPVARKESVRQMIRKASKPVLATSTTSADDMLAYDGGYQPNVMEGLGLTTDEDGLYALKM